MLDYIIEEDKEWLCCLNQMGSAEADAVWLAITNEFTSTPLYAFLLYLRCKYLRWKRVLLILVCIALIVATIDQLANVFKHGFQRPCPCHDETLIDRIRMVIHEGKCDSFLAHASNIMVVAVFFSKLLKERLRYITPFLLCWSLVVSYSRIYLGMHLPGDVLVGLTIGALLSLLYYQLFLRLEKKML